MALIDWSDKLSVHVVEFDQDHQRLIDILNSLWEASEERRGHEVIDAIMADLIDYTVTHFAREEEMFARWSYPGAEKHKQAHRRLIAAAEDLREKFGRERSETVADEVFEFLRDWLVRHILGDDALYASYFRSLGIDSVAADADTGRRPGGLGVTQVAALLALAGGTAATVQFLASGWAAAAAYGAVLAVLGGGAVVLWRGVARPLAAVTGHLKVLSINESGLPVTSMAALREPAEGLFFIRALQGALGDLARKNEESERILHTTEKEMRLTFLGMSEQLESEINAAVSEVCQRSMALCAVADTMKAQAAEVGEQNRAVSTAADDATGTVTYVAEAAEHMAATIEGLRGDAEQSRRIAEAATDEARRSGEIIATLSEASHRIDAVVSMIGAIANQTNMLALNATIEAARSGEAGKGFAVVAGEVKALANQTTQATREIATQIAGIQQAVGQAVQAMTSVDGIIARVSEISSAMASTTAEQQQSATAIAGQARQAANSTHMVSTTIAGISQSATEAEQMSALVHDTVSGVAGQMNEMRDHLIGTLRGSVVGNRREHVRVQMDTGALVTADGRRVECRVKDLSLGGALLGVEGEDFARGDKMVFDVEEVTGVAAEVVRASPKGLHIRLNATAPQRARLNALIAQARAAQVEDSDIDLW
jgi:hemerythrin-like metal-binding domain